MLSGAPSIVPWTSNDSSNVGRGAITDAEPGVRAGDLCVGASTLVGSTATGVPARYGHCDNVVRTSSNCASSTPSSSAVWKPPGYANVVGGG